MTMRFIFLVKSAEDCGTPPKALMDFMATSAMEAFQNGTMIETGGLAPSAMSVRVRLDGGAVSVHDGPFTESKEIIGGYAIMELPSRKEALESATWLMNSHKQYWSGWEGEVEVRQMIGPADLEQRRS
jgi:hypothetical protein